MSDIKNPPNAKKVDVINTAYELANLMNTYPDFTEKDLLAQGEELLSFSEDTTFDQNPEEITKLKAQVLEMAIQDVSSGVMTLKSSSLGITSSGQKLATFINPHGTIPKGKVIYFINWKQTDGLDISQEHINIAVYCLAERLSRILKKDPA